MAPIAVEICTDSVAGAVAAEAGGADRVELCDNLIEGGTTPSSGMIHTVRQRTSLGLHVIIRPRGGDFCYTDDEFAVMQSDIEEAKAKGADGVVIGLLEPDGTIDQERTAALIALARPLSVTFHRAFDMTADPQQALADLIALGIDRILTSGQQSSAGAGAALIRTLVDAAAGRVIIMPGGGIDEQNVATLVQETGAREVHLSARSPVESAMHFRRGSIHMGLPGLSEYERKVTDSTRVRAVVTALAAW